MAITTPSKSVDSDARRMSVSDFDAIESAASADFDIYSISYVTGAGNPYIINGFAINFASNPIGGAASNLQVVVANGALLHTTAIQSGTFFLVPAGTPKRCFKCCHDFKCFWVFCS